MRENLMYKPAASPAEKNPSEFVPQNKSANDSKFGQASELPPEFPQNAHIETIVVDEALAEKPPRLTRDDFTQEAIEKARARVNRAFATTEVPSRMRAPATSQEIPKPASSGYPEHWKIEPELRVHEATGENTPGDFGEAVERVKASSKRLTRADFPGTGSAVMPELVYKKAAPTEKKSFFKRLVPNFISKYFSR